MGGGVNAPPTLLKSSFSEGRKIVRTSLAQMGVSFHCYWPFSPQLLLMLVKPYLLSWYVKDSMTSLVERSGTLLMTQVTCTSADIRVSGIRFSGNCFKRGLGVIFDPSWLSHWKLGKKRILGSIICFCKNPHSLSCASQCFKIVVILIKDDWNGYLHLCLLVLNH